MMGNSYCEKVFTAQFKMNLASGERKESITFIRHYSFVIIHLTGSLFNIQSQG